jgi:microcystin-dependent protein
MSEPFLAEIRIMGFNFPPRGWATCDGQILPINQNQSLFALMGTTYGGDGRTSFGLPDLRGRSPRHNGGTNGGKAGEETHPLTEAEIPGHDHTVQGTNNAQNLIDPTDALQAKTAGGRRSVTPYVTGNNLTPMVATSSSGSGSGHNNMQPYLTLNFVIALQGLFPSRN